VIARDGTGADDFDGTRSVDGRVIGTSIHGLFDSAPFRRRFIDRVRESKGLAAIGRSIADDSNSQAARIAAFDRAADLLEEHVDMSRLAALAGMEWTGQRRAT
jgi:adenosylcobyric acid synthase